VKPADHYRALRMPFAAAISITDVDSERQVSGRTSDLSVRGCFMATPTSFGPGVKIRITIVHAGAKVVAFGRVVYAHAEGMGVAFTKIEASDQEVLEGWISDLRDN
jgi:hypothetical protein